MNQLHRTPEEKRTANKTEESLLRLDMERAFDSKLRQTIAMFCSQETGAEGLKRERDALLLENQRLKAKPVEEPCGNTQQNVAQGTTFGGAPPPPIPPSGLTPIDTGSRPRRVAVPQSTQSPSDVHTLQSIPKERVDSIGAAFAQNSGSTCVLTASGGNAIPQIQPTCLHRCSLCFPRGQW